MVFTAQKFNDTVARHSGCIFRSLAEAEFAYTRAAAESLIRGQAIHKLERKLATLRRQARELSERLKAYRTHARLRTPTQLDELYGPKQPNGIRSFAARRAPKPMIRASEAAPGNPTDQPGPFINRGHL